MKYMVYLCVCVYVCVCVCYRGMWSAGGIPICRMQWYWAMQSSGGCVIKGGSCQCTLPQLPTPYIPCHSFWVEAWMSSMDQPSDSRWIVWAGVSVSVEQSCSGSQPLHPWGDGLMVDGSNVSIPPTCYDRHLPRSQIHPSHHFKPIWGGACGGFGKSEHVCITLIVIMCY